MSAILQFELKQASKDWVSYFLIIILVFSGLYMGNKFNLSISEGLYINSAFSLGYLIGILSLSVLFIAVLFATQLLYKDRDSRFDQILFSLPLSKNKYVGDRFIFFFSKTYLSFIILILGFAIGQVMRDDLKVNSEFNLINYIYPLLIFGLQNSLFVCSLLFLLTQFTRSKLVLVLAALLLYVFYMLFMVFSNSPFMSSSLPQSLSAERFSALFDPFGISAYFSVAKQMTIQQKNFEIVPFEGLLLFNRILFAILSSIFIILSYWKFQFVSNNKKANKKQETETILKETNLNSPFVSTTLSFSFKESLRSILSSVQIDLKYLFKGVYMISISILLLFYVGMEMYGEIEKGIRIPQKFASSGLMATTILENFHFFGLLIVVYFCNDLFWRSETSGFSLIEKTCYFSKNKTISHFLSLSFIIVFFCVLLIIEGVIFQIGYGYLDFDWKAYSGVFLFNAAPILLFSALILLINKIFKNRFSALGVSVVALLLFTGPLAKKTLANPLFQLFSSYSSVYSDFNGYGYYPGNFTIRLIFGISLLGLLWYIFQWSRSKIIKTYRIIFPLTFIITGLLSAFYYLQDYQPRDKEKEWQFAVDYEKSYKQKYLNAAQPTITDIKTEIDLFPSKYSYKLHGTYSIENKSKEPIHQLLINFPKDLHINKAEIRINSKSYQINQQTTEITPETAMQPSEKATMEFELQYISHAVNGHESFNSIIENGSFMRISRYYPTFGYQSGLELENEQIRKQYGLGVADAIKSVNAISNSVEDFINLNMIVSTDSNQTAIGTGDLVKKWKKSNRQYFEYQAENIPFRFAVSSAKYAEFSSEFRGIPIHIYYHPKHSENVSQFIDNAKSSLEYCIDNFGHYPFKSIQFVEISSFTSGFAGTAYPASIFMTEDMIFHANLKGKQEEDVINEITGHELSHLWWGNSQIDPDNREGATMLTESLAMYTEMMLYKKQYGIENMKKRLKIHEQIFESEKGYYENQPLYKVKAENTHISYSLGAMVMVKLSELLTEEKVNLALSNFIKNNKYPKKPSSLDLIEEFLRVSPDEKISKEIEKIFMMEW